MALFIIRLMLQYRFGKEHGLHNVDSHIFIIIL